MREIPADKDVSVESLLGQAADEFTRRCANGEQPDIEEYASRYPQIAAIIREVFPALQVMPAPEAGLDGPDHPADSELPAAGILGDYRLVRELGRGGMGVVYEAEQISLGRRVALKVLSFAAVLDQKQLQRFKNEAQAAAQLHHTNIVPVFSVGCERGVHYYAMQYIEGHPLSAVIRELRQVGGLEARDERPPAGKTLKAAADASSMGNTDAAPVASGSSSAARLLVSEATCGLSGTGASEGSPHDRAFFRSVVQLAVQAAQALQHAHERGVIHRDIKPSNLLLDTDGRLWVTDFGLAMVQTDPGLTLTGDLLGTIRYMSPEQALAKRVPVDHRTDIYSLGVTLYELLTLTPAFTGGDRQELLRQIAFEEPRPLRRVNDAIPKELETIVGKAIAKNPGERYGTAQELADDLRRFLEDKPILARPPTLLDRAAKWARRHRPVVAAGIILLVLSVVGLSVSTVMIARERVKAMRERDAAREQKQLAETNLRAAREVVDRMLTGGPAVNPPNAPNAERLRLTLEQESLAVAKALAAKSPEPAARRDLANAYVRLGNTYAQFGQDDSAEQAYRAAAGVLEKLRRDVPNVPAYGVDLARADLRLGNLLWQKRRYADAGTVTRQAHTLMTAIVSEFPQSRPYRQQLAGSLDLLGLVLRDTGRAQEAETLLRESIRLREKLVSESLESTERPQQSFELAGTERNLADLLMKTGRRDEAEATIRSSISRLEQLTNWFPDNTAYAAELARTRRWWEEVLRLAGQQRTPMTSDTPSGYSEMLAGTHQTLENALEGTGQPEEADAAYRQAVDRAERLAREFPAKTRYRQDLIGLHRTQARRLKTAWLLEEAEATLRKTIEIEEALVAGSPDNPQYRNQLQETMAELDSVRGRRPLGEMMRLSNGSPAEVARAVELARNMDVATIAANPCFLTVIADHLALGNDYARAEALARQATEMDPDNGFASRSLGWALLGLGRVEEAREAFRKVLAVPNIQTVEEAVGGWPEPSASAYLLDMVTQDRYVNRWQGVVMYGSRFDPWPWFWVGVRMELEGRPAEAVAAYRTCETLGQLPKAHYTAQWAAYRLQMLAGAEPSASSRPGAQAE